MTETSVCGGLADVAGAEPPGVLVLGMHRSGTSAATRMINELGPAACGAEEWHEASSWSPSGLWESRTLVAFCNELLTQMGHTWFYPPPGGKPYFELAARLTTSHERARKVFADVHTEHPWLWKDPRACLLLPFWRTVLEEGPVAVVVTRNPLEVAASLKRRNDLSMEVGVALWERYNRLLLEHAKGMPVLVTRYDDLVGDPVRWQEQMRDFLSQTGLQLRPVHPQDARELANSRNRHSVHSRADVAAVAPGALATLDALESLIGVHSSFEPPELPDELPSVEAQLASVSRQIKPPTNRVPWRMRPGGIPGELRRQIGALSVSRVRSVARRAAGRRG